MATTDMTIISLHIQAPKKECNKTKNWLSPFPWRKSPPKTPAELLVFYWLELGHMLIVGPITVKGKKTTMIAPQANDVSRLEVGYIAFRNQRKARMSITYI